MLKCIGILVWSLHLPSVQIVCFSVSCLQSSVMSDRQADWWLVGPGPGKWENAARQLACIPDQVWLSTPTSHLIRSHSLCLCLATQQHSYSTQTEAVGSVGALGLSRALSDAIPECAGNPLKWRQMSWCRCCSSSPLTFVILLPQCGHVETGAGPIL